MLEVEKDPELRVIRGFIFDEQAANGLPAQTTRSKTFECIRLGDRGGFAAQLSELQTRRASAASEWIWDDCLVFLLLIANARFGGGQPVISKILSLRRETINAALQRINETFDSILRGEFAVEGEYAFLKCVYRSVTEKWVPDETECVKLYRQLTQPGFYLQLEPFLRLLALRAFDLVIERRTPGASLSWEQVFVKLQEDTGKLTVLQFFKLLRHLKLSVICLIIASLTAIFSAGMALSAFLRDVGAAKNVQVQKPKP